MLIWLMPLKDGQTAKHIIHDIAQRVVEHRNTAINPIDSLIRDYGATRRWKRQVVIAYASMQMAAAHKARTSLEQVTADEMLTALKRAHQLASDE